MHMHMHMRMHMHTQGTHAPRTHATSHREATRSKPRILPTTLTHDCKARKSRILT